MNNLALVLYGSRRLGKFDCGKSTKCMEKLWIVSKELEMKEKPIKNNINDFVDLFNDAVDWLTTDINDPGYQVLNEDEIVSSLKNQSED